MTSLPKTYYQQDDVLFLSQNLLGKYLYTHFDGVLTGGMITETEAYRGPEDRASHAHKNRCTERNKVMFEAGGICYVYICYGIHTLFNVVTNISGIPHAILIRAIKPQTGIETMQERRKKNQIDHTLTSGPGSLTQALGISKEQNGFSLSSSSLYIEDCGISIPESKVVKSPRIGIDYAGDDALLPWRFTITKTFHKRALKT